MVSRLTIRGVPAFQRRLHAVAGSFVPIGRRWGDGTVDRARPIAPKRSGRGARSIRVESTTPRRTRVVALWYMVIVDRGSQAHTIVPRRARNLVFQAGGRTVFSKRVHKPAMRGMGFAAKAGRRSLRDTPMSETVIRQWNDAA